MGGALMYRLARVLVVALLALTVTSASAGRPVRLVVVLGFDDGSADQMQVAPLLRARALRATFYVNSGLLGSSSYYMTWDQVHDLAADGDEIAGHTLTHPDLTTLTPDQQRHEICGDRDLLVAHGFDPVGFAYPYGRNDAVSVAAVHDCGYTSARVIGGLATAYSCPTGCPDRPFVESVPPRDPVEVRAANLGPDELTLDALQKVVGDALHHVDAGGHDPGVLPLYFHNVCDAPCPGGFGWVRPATFAQFLDWLGEEADQGTVVATNREALRMDRDRRYL
jgi:peptidoglycan/xylan/chitin deacetylase (PgdA/CDA1 family)